MRRRTVLGLGAAALGAVAVGVPTVPASADTTSGGSTSGGSTSGGSSRRRAVTFLDAAMDAYPAAGPIRLAQSYADQSGLFSTAFVYDNAVAILAYLACGDRSALQRAAKLGDALIYAQNHDPVYTDGRLRQAYNVGPYTFYDGVPQPDGFVRADGTANIGAQFGFTGTAVGDMAWPGMALVALYSRTGVRRYLDAAVRIGDWIHANAYSTQPLGGYKFGVDGANKPLPFSATEHNIDCVGFFGQLAKVTGNRIWHQRRAHAEAFVTSMFDRAGGFFYTGTNDGVAINRTPVPEDTQTWSYLALRSARYARSVDYASRSLAVLDTAARPNSAVPAGLTLAGVTFSSASLAANEDAVIAPFQPKPDRNGVWFEGTAHLASALRHRGGRSDCQHSTDLIRSIERAQEALGGAQTIGGVPLPERAGVVAASSPLDTGFNFGYYPYRHVGATAWYLIAATGSNPFDGTR
jgi:hypothetical protein